MNETVKEWIAKAEGDFCARLYEKLLALIEEHEPSDKSETA